MTGSMIEAIASYQVLEQAFQWLCLQRRDANHNDDIWHLRFHWQKIKPRLQSQLLYGRYRFSPCKAWDQDGQCRGDWSAEDALVQKSMALVLEQSMGADIGRYYRQLKKPQAEFEGVDKRSAYAAVNHRLLRLQLLDYIDDMWVMTLIQQFLNHLDDVCGELFSVERGGDRRLAAVAAAGGCVFKRLEKSAA